MPRGGLNARVASRSSNQRPHPSVSPFSDVWARIGHSRRGRRLPSPLTAGDGLIGTAPDQEILSAFEAAGGTHKPRFGQLTVCWAEDEATARKTALELWPNAAVPGELGQELALPRHFEQVAELISEDDVAAKVICSPDADAHRAAIQEFADAGYDHVYIHQVGPDQEGFLDFYSRKILA